MKAVRRYAEFTADFPDDWIWNSDETQTVQTGGKAIAEAIAQILTGAGCTIEKLEDHVEHCWECNFSYQGLELTFQAVDLQPAIFILKEPPRSRLDYDLYRQVLVMLDGQMRRDGRFNELVWYAYDGRKVGKEPFVSPIEEDAPAAAGIKPKRSVWRQLLAMTKRPPDNR